MLYLALSGFAFLANADSHEAVEDDVDCGYSKAFGGFTDMGADTCGMNSNLIMSKSCPGPRRGCDAHDCRALCADDLTCNYYYYGKTVAQPTNWCYLWTQCEGAEAVIGNSRTYIKQCGEGAGVKDGVRVSLLSVHHTCSEPPIWTQDDATVLECRNRCVTEFLNGGEDACHHFSFWKEDGKFHCEGFGEVCTLVQDVEGMELYQLERDETPEVDCTDGVTKVICNAIDGCNWFRGECWPEPDPADFDCGIDDYSGKKCKKKCCKSREPRCMFTGGQCVEATGCDIYEKKKHCIGNQDCEWHGKDGCLPHDFQCSDIGKKGPCNALQQCDWHKGCNEAE